MSSRRWRRVPGTPRRLQAHASVGAAGAHAAQIYRPLKLRARAAAAIGRAMLSRGLVPIAAPPPVPGIEELLQRLGIDATGLCCLRSSWPNRFVIGAASDAGLVAVLKVGPPDDVGLDRERRFLSDLTNDRAGFRVPSVIWSGTWRGLTVLVTEAVTGRDTATFDEVVDLCVALGRHRERGIVHGDLAPWNVVWDGEPVVLDWEHASSAYVPLHDLAHFVVQEGALLRRHSPHRAIQVLVGAGSSGAAYLARTGHDPEDAAQHLRRYLEQSSASIGGRGLWFRSEMLRGLDQVPL